MKLVVLDGYTENPGDLSWGELEKLGELTVYDRTSLTDEKEIIERIGDAGKRRNARYPQQTGACTHTERGSENLPLTLRCRDDLVYQRGADTKLNHRYHEGYDGVCIVNDAVAGRSQIPCSQCSDDETQQLLHDPAGNAP